MSNRGSASTFASSWASEESSIATLRIVSLLEDVDTYAGNVFDVTAKTINNLQRLEQLKSNQGERADMRKLEEREDLLTSYLRRTKSVQDDLGDMRQADFGALSLVWGSGVAIFGEGLLDMISILADIERQVLGLVHSSDSSDYTAPVPACSETADQLVVQHMSLRTNENHDSAIRHRRDVHPCRGGLELIRGNDTGWIERCLKRDLKPTDVERLKDSGSRGSYLFWRCNSCQFRIKYLVSQSRAASLLTNDDHLGFKESTIQCTRAFFAMSHLEQREGKRLSSSPGPYTCLLCALHRPGVEPGCKHTFSNKNDYAKHIEDSHINATLPPTFVVQKLGIEIGNGLPEGTRKVLWTG